MKKILLFMLLSVSLLFADINFQTASKEEIMSIKGIGSKKADAIIEYRKTNKIKSIDDLINIKGFGPSIISKIKQNKSTLKIK